MGRARAATPARPFSTRCPEVPLGGSGARVRHIQNKWDRRGEEPDHRKRLRKLRAVNGASATERRDLQTLLRLTTGYTGPSGVCVGGSYGKKIRNCHQDEPGKEEGGGQATTKFWKSCRLSPAENKARSRVTGGKGSRSPGRWRITCTLL